MINNVFSLDLKGRFFHKGNYGFVCYKKELRDFLFGVGFPSGKKSQYVCIPDVILNSKNSKMHCAFLRGLFDTDGNLSFRKSHAGINKFNKNYNHYPTIKLTTISKTLAEGIIKILHEIDILFNYHIRDSKKLNESRKYIITISGIDGLGKWMDLIGMKNRVKLSRYLIWKKFGYCPSNTTL